MSRLIPDQSVMRQKGSSSSLYSMETKLNGKDSVILDVESEETNVEQKEEVKLLFLDITHLSRLNQFMALTAAVFVFYLVYGYIQELLFKLEGFKPHGWYLTLVQFACYTCFGIIEMQATRDITRRIPLRMYAVLAFLTVATMGLSNTSVGYLNYPTQVIFKCCKLIPVMIGGVLIQRKVYKPIDVCAVLCMCFGLILFTLADSTVYPNFDPYGVLLISLALCADGAIGNVQEKTMKQYKSTNSEMVLYSYGIGFIYLFVGLVISGELFSGFSFFRQYPVETYGYAVIFSIFGYVGVSVVLSMVKSFGALIAVTVTTCRKAVTIILSFVFFTKPFTFQYVWSGLIVVLGIYLNVYSKNKITVDAYVQNKIARVKKMVKKKSPSKQYPGTTII